MGEWGSGAGLHRQCMGVVAARTGWTPRRRASFRSYRRASVTIRCDERCLTCIYSSRQENIENPIHELDAPCGFSLDDRGSQLAIEAYYTRGKVAGRMRRRGNH